MCYQTAYASQQDCQAIFKLAKLDDAHVINMADKLGAWLYKLLKSEVGRTKHKQCGTVPYGYAYLQGQLVVDPKEYKIVLEMSRRWTNGKSYRSIARYLDDQMVKPRKGAKWNHEVVKQIVQRHQSAGQP